MVGEHINRKSGRLLKIYRRKDWLAFEYQTVLGSKIMEKWRVSDLYDFWLLLSNERKDPYEMAERVLDRECERA